MIRTCPVTGLMYCDDIASDVRHARRLRDAALAAKVTYQWLPTNYREREEMKRGGSRLDVMRSHFARDLAAVGYDLSRHPGFPSYVEKHQ